jgi:hypothetical protein
MADIKHIYTAGIGFNPAEKRITIVLSLAFRFRDNPDVFLKKRLAQEIA